MRHLSTRPPEEAVLRLPLALVFLLALILLLGGAAGVQAQDGDGLALSAVAGYDGYFKDEQWVPIHVAVANSGAPVEGELRVVTGGSASNQVVYASPVSLPTRSDKRVTLYVYLPGFASELDVLLVDDEGDTAANATVPVRRLSRHALLYGVVSDEPVDLDLLEDVTGNRTEAAVAYIDVEHLPEAGAAWSNLDVLIFTNVDSGRLTPEQREALSGWVALGGQLVVTGGSGWQQTAAAFVEQLPATPAGSATVDDLPSLRLQTGVPFRDSGPYLVTESSLRAGETLLHEDGLPLLARVAEGRGGFYFLALDPSAAPLLDWDGSEALWRMVAEQAPETPAWTQGPRNSYSAAQAVGRLASLRLPSTLWLALFIFFYVIVAGPANYLVLRRLGRRELAWISIPALILFFSVLAYLTGFRLRGNDVIVNQMAVTFGHVDGEQMRVSSLLGLYSPSRSTYDVHLPPDLLVRPFDRESGTMAGTGNLQAVEQGSDTILRRVRVDVSDMETFVADSYAPLPAITGQATLRLEGSGGELEVQVQNNGTRTLEDAGLLFGSAFAGVGDLAPGESRTVTQTLTTRQAAAVAGWPTGGAPASFTGSAPLNAFYADLLGTTNYYDDPDVFPRFQLLESLNSYDSTSMVGSNQATLLLVGWSETPYVDFRLDRPVSEDPATAFHILEIPVTSFSASGSGIEVPLEMMNWQVLSQNGVYDAPSISNFYMPFGWVEFEFEPWPLFRDMAVTELAVVLQAEGSTTSQAAPSVALWDWERESWFAVPDVVWGTMNIGAAGAYLGPDNEVRLRLQNDGADINIRAVYPSLRGNLE